MEVSIVSKEFIMPSCGISEHPKTHLLSYLDQIAPSFQVPVLLFYSFGADAVTGDSHVDDIIKKRSESLKQSLSKTLASYYPLAGRLSDDKNSVICSDEGVYFVEASANSNLFNFHQSPDLFHKLLPAGATDSISLVQVTRFTCGGMAIGASISHKIADGSSLSFFLRSWAAIRNVDRGPYQLSAPNFDGSTFFPQTDASDQDSTAAVMRFSKRGRAVIKKFVFDAEAIVLLKTKASSSTCKRSPSRVEAVSALICKSMAAAIKARSGTSKPIYTTHGVNIRRRAMPSFPESCMGNYVGLAPAALGIIDQDVELHDLVIKMREGITKTINSDYVKSLQSEPAKYLEIHREVGEVAGGREVEYIGFNSWCNLGFYDVDFGWGKPMWIGNQAALFQFGDDYLNFVFLMDTRSKDGVEAWIILHEEEMAILEQDKKYLLH